MVRFFQFLLVLLFNFLFPNWTGLDEPVSNVIQVNIPEPFFDLKGLNGAVAHSNCVYKLVETGETFKSDNDVEWYPKMRPIAECTTGDCQLLSMRMLFLTKHSLSTTYDAYWGLWHVACTQSTSTAAEQVVIARHE